MRTRLLNLATALSAILCAACLILAIRSFTSPEILVRYPSSLGFTTFRGERVEGSTCQAIKIEWGSVRYTFDRVQLEGYDSRDPSYAQWHRYPILDDGPGALWPSIQTTYRTEVEVPLWMPILLFAIAPTMWGLRMWRAHRRSRAAQCVHCGYDLRATPERCPECGTSVHARQVAAIGTDA